MSRRVFELPPDVAAQVATLATDLQSVVDAAWASYHRRSATWRDGPDGTAAAAWCELVEHLATDLERLPDKPPPETP